MAFPNKAKPNPFTSVHGKEKARGPKVMKMGDRVAARFPTKKGKKR